MARPDRGGLRTARITTATTTAVKTGTGVLAALIFEAASAGIVTVNDSTGAKLVLPAAQPVGRLELGFTCAGKIEVVTAGADRIVVEYD